MVKSKNHAAALLAGHIHRLTGWAGFLGVMNFKPAAGQRVEGRGHIAVFQQAAPGGPSIPAAW